MTNHNPSSFCVRVVDRYRDIPEPVKKFGNCPVSTLNSPDKGLIEASLPLNTVGEKMYPFDASSEIEYCVIVSPPADAHNRNLAFEVINKLSTSGIISRYDMPDGTLFYVSFE